MLNRSSLLALAAVATLGSAAFAPTTASAYAAPGSIQGNGGHIQRSCGGLCPPLQPPVQPVCVIINGRRVCG
jgi:hypothetical protein